MNTEFDAIRKEFDERGLNIARDTFEQDQIDG